MCAGIEFYGNLLDEENTPKAEATESVPGRVRLIQSLDSLGRVSGRLIQQVAVRSSGRNLQSTAVSNNELMPKEDACKGEVPAGRGVVMGDRRSV